MTDLPDWAKDRARDWLIGPGVFGELDPVWLDTTTDGVQTVASLAALLVKGRAEIQTDWGKRVLRDTLAEVRRVVEGMLPPDASEHRAAEGDNLTLDRYWTGWTDALDTVLSRLDPLRVEDLLDGLPRLSTEAEALKAMGDGQPLVKMREIR